MATVLPRPIGLRKPCQAIRAPLPVRIGWAPDSRFVLRTKRPGCMRSGGRVVEGARLESEYRSKAYRGFEYHPLRHPHFRQSPPPFARKGCRNVRRGNLNALTDRRSPRGPISSSLAIHVAGGATRLAKDIRRVGGEPGR